jgi:hypothetical protein
MNIFHYNWDCDGQFLLLGTTDAFVEKKALEMQLSCRINMLADRTHS